MLEQFLSQVSYSSYEDFTRNFRINVPERFNFAYDVVDRIAR
jgi:acetyl-CoA synthetase